MGLFSRFPTPPLLSIFLWPASNSRAFDDDLYQAAAEALFLPPLCQSNTHMLTNFRTQATFFASRDERRGRVASRPEGLWERLFGADIYFYSSQQHRTFLANPLGNWFLDCHLGVPLSFKRVVCVCVLAMDKFFAPLRVHTQRLLIGRPRIHIAESAARWRWFLIWRENDGRARDALCHACGNAPCREVIGMATFCVEKVNFLNWLHDAFFERENEIAILTCAWRVYYSAHHHNK